MNALVLLACGTHLGESLAFAGPPLALIAGLAVMTVRARRADADADAAAAHTERLGVLDGSPVG